MPRQVLRVGADIAFNAAKISPTALEASRAPTRYRTRESTRYRPLSAWLRARRKRSLGRCVRALQVRRAPQTLAPRRNRQGDDRPHACSRVGMSSPQSLKRAHLPLQECNRTCAAQPGARGKSRCSPDRTAGQSDSPHVHAHSEREAKRCGSAAVARRSISPASQLRSKRKSPTQLGHASLTGDSGTQA